jgi:deazaflavin-dependent oxidoreductase (nitroreductase family)
MYSIIGFLDPWIRPWWVSFGLGNVVDLRVVGRRTGAPRRVLLTLLRDGEQWFLGHPNGDVAWTRNLDAAGTADIVFRAAGPVTVKARRLDPRDPVAAHLRDRAIASTGQHPFPGNVIYRLARAHIRAVGVYFAVDRASVP